MREIFFKGMIDVKAGRIGIIVVFMQRHAKYRNPFLRKSSDRCVKLMKIKLYCFE